MMCGYVRSLACRLDLKNADNLRPGGYFVIQKLRARLDLAVGELLQARIVVRLCNTHDGIGIPGATPYRMKP